MTNSETMRRNAENCLEMAAQAKSKSAQLRYMRMANAWQDLAENQDWLDSDLRRAPPIQPSANPL